MLEALETDSSSSLTSDFRMMNHPSCHLSPRRALHPSSAFAVRGLACAVALTSLAGVGRGEAALLTWLPAEKISSGGLALVEQAEVRSGPPAVAPTAQALFPKAPTSLADPGPVGPNIRLGDDPEVLPPDRRAQAEPHLARSFATPGLLLGTFQEGRFSDGGAVTCGYVVSRDGGNSWERRLIPGLVSSLDGGPFDRASDPVAAVGPEDTLFLSTLGLNGDPASWLTGITLHVSRDQGRTFAPPIIVAESTNSAVFLDKNWLAVNNFPGTPTTGRLVVTLTRFHLSPINGLTLPIALTFSDDDGATWSELEIISTDNCQGSQSVFLPDGSLAVAYWDFTGADVDHIRLRFSPDGGRTFDPVREVATVVPHRDPVARSAEFLPAMAADRTLGNLHVVWQAKVDGPRILYTRSHDQGRTWSTPIPVNDTPSGRSVFNPAVAVSPDGLHVTVIFYDKRHDDGSGQLVDLYLAESFDGGETWEPNHRVTPVSSDLRQAPLTSGRRMLGDYQGIVPALNLEVPGAVIWVDTRDESPDPWTATITRRRGATFAAWQQVAFADPAAAEARPEADPDGDLDPNLLEYLVGASPMLPNPPALRPVPGDAGSPPTFAFRSQATVADVGPSCLQSADLNIWAPVVPARLDPRSSPPAFRHWSVTLDVAGAESGFLRLGAREN